MRILLRELEDMLQWAVAGAQDGERFTVDEGICQVGHTYNVAISRHNRMLTGAGFEEDPETEHESGNIDLMVELFKEWPEFSGLSFFPVTHPDVDDPGEGYYQNAAYDKWGGTYGADRIDLLRFVIRRLDQIRKERER